MGSVLGEMYFNVQIKILFQKRLKAKVKYSFCYME